ncbi:hypothetical protein COO60DRAFT_1515124 [Scenedesmus sp. NREL 46B-D3]|nr:hypothetical protein COO60DRAFT_1515124 [Scenedesmus sp. NREL 46B-D3]
MQQLPTLCLTDSKMTPLQQPHDSTFCFTRPMNKHGHHQHDLFTSCVSFTPPPSFDGSSRLMPARAREGGAAAARCTHMHIDLDAAKHAVTTAHLHRALSHPQFDVHTSSRMPTSAAFITCLANACLNTGRYRQHPMRPAAATAASRHAHARTPEHSHMAPNHSTLLNSCAHKSVQHCLCCISPPPLPQESWQRLRLLRGAFPSFPKQQEWPAVAEDTSSSTGSRMLLGDSILAACARTAA